MSDELIALRDRFAAAALQGMCSPLDDGGVYPPDHSNGDFEPWPQGKKDDLVYFLRNDGTWACTFRNELGKKQAPHRLVTTYEEAIARSAYRFADAMLAARGGAA